MTFDGDAQHHQVGPRPLRVAQYLRKSTERQELSNAIQSAANHVFAAAHGMEIVRTYRDDGVSGLHIKGRQALQQLLSDVETGNRDFSAVLVYDVSRWGRFQDIDEGGYYEFLCKREGIAVHYCAEPFENDGSVFATIVKNLKRAMAGEYSRELSAKVYAGHARLVALGFTQGGSASYGLRRVLVDENRKAKLKLERGDWINARAGHVILVPGPVNEVDTVRRIFQLFVEDKLSEPQIARELNSRNIPAIRAGRWRPRQIRNVLQNERYIGHYTWNRYSLKLGAKPTRNDPDKWLRAKDTIEPIVDAEIFDAAQKRIHERRRKLTQQERLEPLRDLLRQHGRLSTMLVDEAPGVPSVKSYALWFGSMTAAYDLVGYEGYMPRGKPNHPRRSRAADTAKLSDRDLLRLLQGVFEKNGFLNSRVINDAEGVPHVHIYMERFGGCRRAYRLAGFIGKADDLAKQTSAEARRAFGYVMSDRQMLVALTAVHRDRGKLTRAIIDTSPLCPSSYHYACRFGTIERAYELVGFRPSTHQRLGIRTRRRSDDQLLDLLRRLLEKEGRLSRRIIDQSNGMTSATTYARRFGNLHKAYALIGYDPDETAA